jgi:hypothetical protein
MYIRPQHSTEPSDIEEHVCPKVAEMVVGAFALAPLLSNMKAQATPLTILSANVLPLLASAWTTGGPACVGYAPEAMPVTLAKPLDADVWANDWAN